MTEFFDWMFTAIDNPMFPWVMGGLIILGCVAFAQIRVLIRRYRRGGVAGLFH